LPPVIIMQYVPISSTLIIVWSTTRRWFFFSVHSDLRSKSQAFQYRHGNCVLPQQTR
jgi:hypothetical protein